MAGLPEGSTDPRSVAGQSIWREHHTVMANWRGREADVAAAEAFVHLNRTSRLNELPGL